MKAQNRDRYSGSGSIDGDVADLFGAPNSATPMEPCEREGLFQGWVTVCADLNEAEQMSTDTAVAWANRRDFADVPMEAFAHELHERIFGAV